jgi:tyrosine-protein kinase Etk/Wzc
MEKDLKSREKSDGELNEVRPMDYVHVLVKWRRFIIINVLVFAAVIAGISFLLPNWYKATVSILPPKDRSMSGGLSALAQLTRNFSPLSALTKLTTPQDVYNYIAILKSRTAMEAVINKFHLVDVYETSNRSMEKTIKELEENTNFEVQDEGNFTIEVLDKDPQRAAAIANFFVETLNRISIDLGTQEARSNRQFIEKRVEEVKASLRVAEDSLKAYQEERGLIILPEETSSSISVIAELYATKERKATELAVLERTVGRNNPLYQQAAIELSELNKRIATIPQTALSSIRLYRNAAIQQKIYEFLLPLYEQAKIDEQRDVPVVLILDKGVPPERKDRPKRLFILLTALVLGLMITSFFVFLSESVRARHKERTGSVDLPQKSLIRRIQGFYKVEV